VGKSYVISENPYGRLIKLGELDGIDIFSLTCPDPNLKACTEFSKSISNILDYIRLIYRGLKQSFASYSEHMILYYLYKRPGINGMLSTKHFSEICGLSEKTWKKTTATAITEAKSTGGTELDEPIVKIDSQENSISESAKKNISPVKSMGLNLLEIPNVEEGTFTIKYQEKEKLNFENLRNGINKGESSLLESEDTSSMCTNNLVSINENFEEDLKVVEKSKDISQIQAEEICVVEEPKKNKDTFINEIGDILKEIGTIKKPH